MDSKALPAKVRWGALSRFTLIGGIFFLYTLGEDPLSLFLFILGESSDDGNIAGGSAEMTSFSLVVLGVLSAACFFLLSRESAEASVWLPTVLSDLAGEPFEDGVCGLYNLGNSCYMSASIQCLNSVAPLRDLIRQERISDLINVENRLGSGGRVVRKCEMF